MTSHPSDRPVSALRARMIEDMRVRGFSEKTRNDYTRNVRTFAAFISRSPDTATAEDLRRFQHHQAQTGVCPPSINSAVAALRFFFTVTLDRPDLARRLTVVREPRRLPAVLSVEEATCCSRRRRGRRTSKTADFSAMANDTDRRDLAVRHRISNGRQSTLTRSLCDWGTDETSG